MVYSDYTLEQIKEGCSEYQTLCNLFFELVSDEETKHKLEEILYNGGCNNFGFGSKICNKDNPGLEMQRRISMAYLLIRNLETFDFLVKNQVNLFHGTNANALPSILKYGLNSAAESEKNGIYVSTGEKSTRLHNVRDYVSFTDILDIAEDYSTLNPEKDDSNLSFEIIIGTTVDDVLQAGRRIVSSDITEVGVKDKLSIEKIKVICVSSEKVEFVKKIVNNDKIKVLAVDGINEKFYYIDDIGKINIFYNEFNKLKDDLQNNLKKVVNGPIFKLEEVKDLMVRWLSSNLMIWSDDKSSVIESEEAFYDRRSR